MNEKVKIMVVDDFTFMHELYRDVLGDSFQIVAVEDGSDAIMSIPEEQPTLILLDVEMAGMNGYETCRLLKNSATTAAIPIIFVSSCDLPEERLKGYEVGGDDYVVKPFNPKELKAKITHLIALSTERKQLKEIASIANHTAMTAICEMHTLLESMQNFNSIIDAKTLAEAILTGISCYGLASSTKVATPSNTIYLSINGNATPLEIFAIDSLSDKNCIVAVENKLSIKYPHISILINNMPIGDPELCERLRDYISMLAGGAEMRAVGIIAENESRQRGLAIEQMSIQVTQTLNEIDAAQRLNRMRMSSAAGNLTHGIEKALLKIELTKDQEKSLTSIIEYGLEEIIGIQFNEADLQDKLTALTKKLKEVVS